MAFGVVLCEFADTPASSISSHLPPRSQVVAAFDGYEASHLFFPAVAVSGGIVYMKGFDFVGSSCVEVPVANPSHALGFLLHTSPIGTRPHRGQSATSPLSCLRQFLSRRAVLQLPVSCASDTCPSCCFFPLRKTRTFFILCAFLLSMWAYVFLFCVAIIGVPPAKSYSFTGSNVCRVSERSIEVPTAYDRAIGSPQDT